MKVIKRNKVNRKKVISASLCLIIASTCLLLDDDDGQERAKRRWWSRPWLDRTKGNISLAAELDKDTYKNFLRMDEQTFNKLLNKIRHRITKTSLVRDVITPEQKLIVTLRYLATGESFRSLQFNYRISESAISLFIPVVCEAIYEELQPDYLKVPATAAEWLEISREFETKWNTPNVIGALDGKHIVIIAPTDQGSAYFNYKKQHSIVLLALVDASYSFTYINVGMNGRLSDGRVYWESDLSGGIEMNSFNIPENKPLPGRSKPMPHVIVADAAFALSNHILKPYPFRNMTKEQRIFNYRLSRARRVVENAFGILANRFRVLIIVIPLKPKKVRIITQACCTLHNFLNKETGHASLSKHPEEIDPKYKFIYGLSCQNYGRPSNKALNIREEFKEYFNGCGRVPWQENIA